MINLKLAEYDLKTGKFNEFFDLGFNEPYSFGFYGDTITVYYAWIDESFSYDLDKKDPLNRFGGLFNGLTYGEGRFVLIQDEDFGVYEQKFFDKKHEEFGYGLNLNGNISCTFKNATSFTGNVYSTSPKLIGNLMENPELYEKLK